jgi:tol-pal system protein YbgF
MKKLLLIVAAAALLYACAPAGQSESVTRNLNAMSEEIAVLSGSVNDLKTTVDELILKNDALSAENAQNIETINELQTEITYLSNEVTVLKGTPAPKTQPAAPTAIVEPAAVSSPKIVIIEDVKAVKDSLYNYAFELYNQGKHGASIEKFSEFLSKFPGDELANNSQYWIGENYYALEQFQKAIEAFRAVISKYPTKAKAPDALLKIGYSYNQMGENANAVNSLNEVISKYPSSDAAKLAKQMIPKWQ